MWLIVRLLNEPHTLSKMTIDILVRHNINDLIFGRNLTYVIIHCCGTEELADNYLTIYGGLR